jgi:hypothetical protein
MPLLCCILLEAIISIGKVSVFFFSEEKMVNNLIYRSMRYYAKQRGYSLSDKVLRKQLFFSSFRF